MNGQYLVKTKPQLEQFVTENLNAINRYIDKQQSQIPMPIYSSVDIRESKDKFAPVDNNLYPAGFNNICKLDLDACESDFAHIINEIAPGITAVGILPEAHTKNTFYLDHLAILKRTIENAGFSTFLIAPDNNIFNDKDQTSTDLISHSGYDVKLYRAKIKNGTFIILEEDNTKIDLLIINNDQSNPLNLPWNELKIPVCPTQNIGWFNRHKTNHFKFYHQVVEDFCSNFNINPNLFEAKFKAVENVDFSEKTGLDTLAKEIDTLLENLPLNSNVFVKASRGTYGMGISIVQSGSEISNMNRKTRNKMDKGKNKIKFDCVLIQEGIETIIKYDEMPAEVTIYLVNGTSIGGFMRANSEKNSRSNLNSRGMVFRKFCISEIRENQEHKSKEAIYSIIARLSTLASGFEIKEVI